jgi:hypothetical protein
MGGFTLNQAWPYPYTSELVRRQNLDDLATAMAGSLTTYDVARLATLRRRQGMLGHTNAVSLTTTVATPAVTTLYLNWNSDLLGGQANGTGAAVATTQGPSLPQGLYRFDFWMRLDSVSGTPHSIEFGFERAGGVMFGSQSYPQSHRAFRLSAPVRIPAGAAQQVRVRVRVAGGNPSSFLYSRVPAESSPRFSWVQIGSA